MLLSVMVLVAISDLIIILHYLYLDGIASDLELSLAPTVVTMSVRLCLTINLTGSSGSSSRRRSNGLLNRPCRVVCGGSSSIGFDIRVRWYGSSGSHCILTKRPAVLVGVLLLFGGVGSVVEGRVMMRRGGREGREGVVRDGVFHGMI